MRAGELRKEGSKIRLQDQPFQILVMLLEHPGQVVTRDELRSKLWAADTFVDFDHSLYKAINKLRDALGDSADKPHFIETLAKRGYRFLPDLNESTGCIRSLLVLPLENLSRDSEQDYFADGLTEALITRLARIRALRVLSRTTAMHYKGTRKPLPEIAQELQVDAVVEGTVLRSGGRVRISAQLIHGPTDTHLWAESYERDLCDVLLLQSEVTRTIASEIQVKLSPQEQTELAQVRRVNPQAYEAYLKGRYYWNRRTGESMKLGLQCFQRAIEIDPTYAAAYAGLADAAAVLGWWGFVPSKEEGFPKAKQAAQTALTIDPGLSEPHACLGFSLMHYDFDLAGAEAEFRKALEQNPGYANARQWYSCVLCVAGRFDECFTQLQLAAQIDPLSLVIKWTYGHLLFHARRYDEAIEWGRKALEPDTNGLGKQVLGIAYAQKGKHEMARAELTEALKLSGRNPNFLGSLGYAHAAARNTDRARRIIRELQELFPIPCQSAYWMAMIHAVMGEKEEACRWLEVGCRERSPQMTYLSVDPRFDNLRSTRRFRDLLRRMNLPEIGRS